MRDKIRKEFEQLSEGRFPRPADDQDEAWQADRYWAKPMGVVLGLMIAVIASVILIGPSISSIDQGYYRVQANEALLCMEMGSEGRVNAVTIVEGPGVYHCFGDAEIVKTGYGKKRERGV